MKLWEELRATLGDRGAAARDARFRAVTEGCAAAVLIVRDDLIGYANPAAGASSGVRREALVGRRFSELAHPDARAALLQRCAELLRSPAGASQRFELTLQGEGGRLASLDLTLSAIDSEEGPSLFAMGFDVTDRKLAEDAMRESERRMRDLIENVQLISLLINRNGEVDFANEYVLELLGYEEEQVVGKNWFELVLPLDRRERVLQAFSERIAKGEVAPHDEYEIVTARGERRFVSWNNTLLHDPKGEVAGMASIGADVTERRRAEERLLHDALHDSLTGLPNRALFMDRLRGAVARLKRRPEYLFAVLFLDVDRFKVINDSLGHVAGDQFLVQLSRLIAATIRRPEHTLARLGGDEFAILLDDIEKREAASRVAERIFQSLRAPIKIGPQEIFSTVSIGIAFSTTEYMEAEEALRDADTAMYQAKTAGKARSQIFDDSMHTRALRLLKLEHSLRRAVDRNEFVLHYQPIVGLQDARVAGFEALVRWDHPERGLIAPYEFIHLAEETGLIYGIGAWTLREACRRLIEWNGSSAPLSMSVNLSARQFSQLDLIEQIQGVLEETGLPPARLKLEITESVIMENPEIAVAMLHRMRELGTRLVIDDFGTGYSSLSYLLRFPADTLKIDRSFVAALGKGGKNEDIVGAIVSLAKSLEMDVVAEGVENQEQSAILKALGCGYAQGFYFSEPLDADAARKLLG